MPSPKPVGVESELDQGPQGQPLSNSESVTKQLGPGSEPTSPFLGSRVPAPLPSVIKPVLTSGPR